MNSNSAIIVPPSAPEQAGMDIRGIKPPLEIGDGWAWIWWVAGVLLVLLVAWFVYRWLRRKAEKPAVVHVTPPHVTAKQRLQQALSLLSDPKLFCTEVSDAIRVYLEDRFQFRAPERTTEEFLFELQSTNHLMPDQKESLGEFLQVCDLVKFAKHEPHESTLRELHDAACRLVDETRFDGTPASINQSVAQPPSLPASSPPPPLPPRTGTPEETIEPTPTPRP